MPTSPELIDQVEPLPGEILVERDWEYRGLIELPDYYIAGVKTPIAKVFKVAPGIEHVKVDQRVALAVGVTRFIEFGTGPIVTRTLYACRPRELLGRIEDESVREVLVEAGMMIHPSEAELARQDGRATEVW